MNRRKFIKALINVPALLIGGKVMLVEMKGKPPTIESEDDSKRELVQIPWPPGLVHKETDMLWT